MTERDATARGADGASPIEPPDLSETGGPKGGQPQRSDERLFMQFLAFGGCADAHEVARHLEGSTVRCVVYEDVNDPRGVAILTVAREPRPSSTRCGRC